MTKYLKLYLPLLLIIGAVSYNAISGDTDKVFNIEKVSKTGYGKAADFIWTENGTEKKFSEVFKDKYLFLNFFGTWCGPCKRELPAIVAISKEMASKDLVVVGIALERPSNMTIDLVKKFAKKRGLPYYIFIDSKRELSQAFGGINAVPTTFLIDKESKISERIQGAQSKAVFMEKINKMIK
jgi:thiol-disulfide isomerase/thioredoxin